MFINIGDIDHYVQSLEQELKDNKPIAVTNNHSNLSKLVAKQFIRLPQRPAHYQSLSRLTFSILLRNINECNVAILSLDTEIFKRQILWYQSLQDKQ